MGHNTTELFNMLDGDQREYAAGELVDRFMNQLLGLIRINLSDRVRKRVDEQDVLQSVWASFFHGDFSVENSGELFSLLSRICINKSKDAARRQTAEKRNVSSEEGPDALEGGRRVVPSSPIRIKPGQEAMDTPLYETETWADNETERMLAEGASPEHALVACELIEEFEPDQQAILVLKLQGLKEQEIAETLKVNRRTVTRKTKLMRTKMQAILEEDKE